MLQDRFSRRFNDSFMTMSVLRCCKAISFKRHFINPLDDANEPVYLRNRSSNARFNIWKYKRPNDHARRVMR